MRAALDNLMLRGPSWIIRPQFDEHPSNGLDEVFRLCKRQLSTVLQRHIGKGIICEVVLYTKVRLFAKDESYGSSGTTTREYILVEFTSNAGDGYLEIPEFNTPRCVLSAFHEADGLYVKNCNDIGRDIFEIIQDHREYPIWPTRRAVLTFLLCSRSLALHKDIVKPIAQMIWDSRHCRKTWWPDVTDEDFE